VRALSLCLTLLLAGPALADAATTAEQARQAEASLDYDVAADLWLTVLGDASASDELVFEAHLRSGVVQTIRGNDTAARLHFRKVLREQPGYRLPEETPPKVRAFFELVREEVELEASPAARPAPASADAEPEPPSTEPEGEGPVDVFPLLVTLSGAGGLAVSGASLGMGAIAGYSAYLSHQEALATDVQTARVSEYEDRDFASLVANSLFVVAAATGVVGAGLVATGFILDAP
jgi:hypothetical protein